MRTCHPHGKMTRGPSSEIIPYFLHFIGRCGCLFHSVIHHLGWDAPWDGSTVVAAIVPVGMVGDPTSLVGGTVGDLAMQPFHIKVLIDESCGQPFKQCRITWWVGRGKLVRWIDDADVEVTRPDPIDKGTSEPGIFLVTHPIHDGFAGVVTWFQ